MKDFLTKIGGTFFLRIAILILGLGVLSLCIFFFPTMAKGIAAEFPGVRFAWSAPVIGYATALLFFAGLYEGLKLLNLIDKNLAFSFHTVKALKKIKYYATNMSGLYAFGLPLAFMIADKDDAPGLILVWCVIICAPIVVAVFSAILQKLVENAIEIKSENDLTV